MHSLSRRLGVSVLFCILTSVGLRAAPTITQQPAMVVATGGTSASFTVAATGTGTVTCQWRRAGVAIGGATDTTFTIANVGPGDAGAYDVAVKDDSGTATLSLPGWLVYQSAPGQLWGAGFTQALGSGDLGVRTVPRTIAAGVARVFAGYGQTFFLKVDGTLWATGQNDQGGLGDGTTTSRTLPVPVATDVVDVAVGSLHTLLLKGDHSLWAVGGNDMWQLGNNSTTSSLTPVHVADGVAQISAGFQHSAYLTQSGDAWLWGYGAGGQLGQGNYSDLHQPLHLLAGVRQIMAGAFCTVFIKNDGTLWGMGEWASTAPTQLASGVTAVAVDSWRIFYIKSDGTLWYRSGIGGAGVDIQADSGVATVKANGWGMAACYLKTDGSAYAYGLNGAPRTPPGAGTLVGTGIAQIASGAEHVMLLDDTGNLSAFGSFATGALGDGHTMYQVWPVRLESGVVAVSAGGNHRQALKSDGTLWAAGLNASGQLGDGTTTARGTPVPGAAGVQQVAAGFNHTLYIETSGTLRAVGDNSDGQLGDGTWTARTAPYALAPSVVACAAGSAHSLYITSDGTLWATGANSYGQLGDGSQTRRNTPYAVATSVVACAAGAFHSLFVKADGTLWAMGLNTNGQLGDGTTTNRSTPVQVATGVVAVDGGSALSLYRTLDGTLYAMGAGSTGAMGNGISGNQLLPVSIASDIVAFACNLNGSDFALFLKADGTLWCAGSNTSGQLGDGTTMFRPLRQQLAADVTGFAAGVNMTFFIQKSGVGSAPVFTTQPQTQSVSAGATCVFTAAATGTAPVGYQWYKDGVALSDAHNPQLILAFVTAADAGAYTVAALDTVGSTVSQAATLTVGAAPAISPVESIVSPGGTASFTVAATGSGPLHYQWYKDGVALAGQTGATLTLANVQRTDVGYYRVRITDDYSSSTAADAALNLPSFPIAPAVADQLALGAASDGTNFLVAIQGDVSNATATTAQLVAPDGSPIGGRIAVGRNGGEAGVGMGGVKAAFDGTNYLLVWADNAVASTTRLYGVFISKAGALVGSPFAFPVSAGASVYQRPQGIAFDGSRYLVAYSDGTDKPWKLCGRFVTPAGVVGDEMIFGANAVDSFQSVAANNGMFLVAWPARIGSSQYGVRGRLVSDAGIVSPTIPIESNYSPSYNPLGIAGNGTDFLVVWNFDTGPGYPSPTQWELRSRIVHPNGTMSAAPVQLCTKTTNPVMPVVACDGASFLVVWTQLTHGGTYPNVTSTPEDMSRAGELDLAGRYVADDGTPLGPIFNLVVGAGNQGLAPLAVGGGQCLVAYNALGGEYGSNGANSVRGLFLPAEVPPTISAQPVSQNFAAGTTATFTVTVSGSNLAYQWRKDGVDIPGARGATLTVGNVQPASFGNYTVVVANATGTVTSEPALLGVVGVAGARYRLLDYFRPLAVGNEWLYLGPGYDATQTHTRIRLENLDYPITTYTGRSTPQAYQESAVFFRSAYGYLTGATFNNTDTWNDFFFANGASVGFLGYDDDPGTEEGRTDGPLVFSETMAVGESFVITKDYYENGVWTGPMAFTIRLLGAESVTVPAGTFNNCLHIRYVTAGTPSDDLNDEWWAPGVGAVKHQDRDPGEPVYERNLLSYTVQLPVAPTISAQPADATIASGATTMLSVTGAGTAPLSYQWYGGDSGNATKPIAGATAADFTTPALTAWARCWVRVSNRSAYVDSRTVLVEVTGGTMKLGDWTAQPGTPANQRGPLDTPAGDGVTNLMKFALGVPPMDRATGHPPTPTTYVQAGQPLAIALLFSENPGAQGIRYALEVSGDMVTWNEVASVTDVLGTNPDGTRLVRMREAAPPAVLRRFARLKVELLP